MAKKKGVKDPFEFAEPEFKNKCESADEDGLKAIIAEVAMNDAALADQKKQDPHLKELKEQVKMASERYVDGAKANKQRIAYARMILDARGKPNGDSGLDESGEAGGLPETAFKKEVGSLVKQITDAAGPGGSVTFGFTGGEKTTVESR